MGGSIQIKRHLVQTFCLVDPFGWGFLWLKLEPLASGQESLPGAVQLFENLLGSDEFGLHAGQGWSAF